MKRLLAIILSLMLICAPALADTITIDPDSATLEELISLRDALNARILALGGEQLLSQGVYEVGKDIPAGDYRLLCGDDVESAFVYVYSAESVNWYSFDRFYALGSFHGSSEIGKLTLTEGSRLDIQGASVTLILVG